MAKKKKGKGVDRKQKKEKPKKTGADEEPEEDIDTILSSFQKQQESMYQVTTERNSAPPTRRANASLNANPLDPMELVMFGGEYFNGKNTFMYNDFYKFNLEKNEWKKITCPHSPGPRSSHQIQITGAGMLFLFGGEFVSPNETSFFHYKDFWMLDLKTSLWEKLEISKPPPRSGHRLTLWKHYIVLFGGFFETSKETRYYDDLWVFDTLEYNWQKLEIEHRPSKRSAFQWMTHGDQLVLYGGFSRTIIKGQKPTSMVHTDVWILKMNLDLKLVRWERKKKSTGLGPSLRSGGTTVYHKGKGILFGGVSDLREDEENLESLCNGDMFIIINKVSAQH